MRIGLLIGILVVAAAPAQASAAGCPGLSGSFTGVRGSAGAGQVSYVLRVKNGGSKACTLTGVPALQLLGRRGKPLPTHVFRAPPFPPQHAFVLQPGKRASATARFSPDVPGVGEQTIAACEREAWKAWLTAGGGRILVPISPPTRVCSHGRLVFTPFH